MYMHAYALRYLYFQQGASNISMLGQLISLLDREIVKNSIPSGLDSNECYQTTGQPVNHASYLYFIILPIASCNQVSIKINIIVIIM